MDASPNAVAYLALLLWVPVSLVLFALLRPQHAALLTLLGAMLLLPVRVAFDAPGMPALGKQEIGNLCLLLGVLFFARRSLAHLRSGMATDVFILLLGVGAAATAHTNGDPVPAGPLMLPAMGTWDVLSLLMQQLLTFAIPFVVGRLLFRRTRDIPVLLAIVAGAGIAYSLPILFEARMSPNLHRMVYGFHQHFFHQSIRLGGFRPMVFMRHGLELSLFVLVCALASTTLARVGTRVGPFPAHAVTAFLALVLLACRSLGALVYAVFLLPLVAFAPTRWQMRVASLLAVLVVVYPLARTAGWFPTRVLVGQASHVSAERADSLAFRFENEDRLLAKALERPWFGWGSYNRNRTFKERTGEPDSITDGYWILQLGSAGLAGFAGAFGLLVVPIWRAHRVFARLRSRRDRALIAGLSVMLATYSVDLLPNAFLVPLVLFLAGALTGLCSALGEEAAPARHEVRREGSAAGTGSAPASRPSPAPPSPRPPRLTDLVRPRLRCAPAREA